MRMRIGGRCWMKVSKESSVEASLEQKGRIGALMRPDTGELLHGSRISPSTNSLTTALSDVAQSCLGEQSVGLAWLVWFPPSPEPLTRRAGRAPRTAVTAAE